MANRLSVAKVHSILTLREQGWSYRRIAAALGVDRETVSNYVQAGRSKPASAGEAPTGSDDSKPATGAAAPTGSPAGEIASSAGGASPRRARAGPEEEPSGSDCEPYRQVILDKLQLSLTAQRIHQDLVADHKDQAPSYYSVRRFVARLTGSHPLPFRRMECEPGAECQVDFGKGAPVIQPASGTSGGAPRPRRRIPRVFRIVLSCSRKAYSEVVWREGTEEFIRCLENAFWHFGGVPRTLILDNLRAAVSHADWFDPEINPKVQSFCEHYGIVPLPCKPRMPRHKGKVENSIGYVKGNGLKGHTFTRLVEENDHLLHWETSVADTRIHGTTRQQVGKVFEEIERPALQPLPAMRFPFFHESQRTVHRDGHVEVDKSYYSVPPEYLGRRVWVRWDGRVVRIFDGQMQQIAMHIKREPGQFSTQDRHLASEKISGVERGACYLLGKAGRIGMDAARWAEAMLEERGIEGVRVLQGLISLAGRHPNAAIDQACRIALSHQAYRLRTIRELIKRKTPAQEQFEFITEHPIIRSLGEYQQLVSTAFTQPAKENYA